AEQAPDAVVLVHDVVARAQVGEGLERAAAETPLARGAPPEDLVVGEQDEAELAPDEAAPRRRDREEELGLVREPVARLEQACRHAAEQVLRAERLAAVRERDDDALPGAYELGELGLRLQDPACRDGGSL